jgi:hypothetical protein
MSDNQPTAETVLCSRHRAAELRRIDRDDLIQAADKARTAQPRVFQIRASQPTANAVGEAIIHMQSEPDTKLGFDDETIKRVADAFAQLADASRSRGTFLTAYLMFCAMSLLKLALEEDLISDDHAHLIEVTT